MAVTRTKYKDNYTFLHQEWLCDTDADIADLPTDAQAGSTAIVISDSENNGGMSVLITDNNGEWHRVEVIDAGGESVTDEHINSLIDAKLGNLDAAVNALEGVIGVG